MGTGESAPTIVLGSIVSTRFSPQQATSPLFRSTHAPPLFTLSAVASLIPLTIAGVGESVFWPLPMEPNTFLPLQRTWPVDSSAQRVAAVPPMLVMPLSPARSVGVGLVSWKTSNVPQQLTVPPLRRAQVKPS